MSFAVLILMSLLIISEVLNASLSIYNHAAIPALLKGRQQACFIINHVLLAVILFSVCKVTNISVTQ